MRKLLFLLLITISSYGQALPNPTLPNPIYGTVTIKNSATVTTTPALTTTEANGLQKKIDPAKLPISTATQTALSGKANDADVLHKTGNLNEVANGEKIFTSKLGVGIFTNPLLNTFEVLVPSSMGDSSTSGMAVHDGQPFRMGLNLGVNTASSYCWLQAVKGGGGAAKPIFLNPVGGGVSIGNTTDPGTGNLNIAGKATAGSPATVANDLMRKGEVDTAIATAVSTVSNWTKTGNDIRNNNTGNVEIKPLSKFSVLNSSNVEVAKIGTEGAFTSKVSGEGFFTHDGYSGMTQSGNQLTFRTAQEGFYFYKPTLNHTAGEINIIQFGSSQTGPGVNINPTSGTGITNLIKLGGVVNQTGGANGITRALYIAPTLTSAADFRAIEVTAGKTILQETEAKKLNLKTTAGSQAVGNATMVAGTVTISTTAATTNSIVMLTRNSAGITGSLSYSTTNGTLTINSTIGADAGIISYLIIN